LERYAHRSHHDNKINLPQHKLNPLHKVTNMAFKMMTMIKGDVGDLRHPKVLKNRI
jgi:hypothetical protein